MVHGQSPVCVVSVGPATPPYPSYQKLFICPSRVTNSFDLLLDAGYTPLRHMGKPLGATFIGISLLVLMIGVNRSVYLLPSPLAQYQGVRDHDRHSGLTVCRYYESQTWLMRGKFPASRGSIFLLTLVACLVCFTPPRRFYSGANLPKLMITTLVIVLVVQPNDYEL